MASTKVRAGWAFGAAGLLGIAFAACTGGAGDFAPASAPDGCGADCPPPVREPSPDGATGSSGGPPPPDASGDAANVEAGGPDAGPEAGPDAATGPDGGGLDDAGAPAVPSLLVSDPGSNRIDLVTTSGFVLHTYPAPVTQVAGVAFDRRKRDGFWVVGRDSGTTIYKIAWSGAALPPLTTEFPHPLYCGLEHFLGASEAEDVLLYVWTNSGGFQSAGGSYVSNGQDRLDMGFYNGGFESGFWGLSFLVYDEPGNVFQGWFTHGTTIERWQTASFQASLPATVTQARGLARTAAGEFWVADEATHHVVHLSATGEVLGGFDTPGSQPAGLSYDPGP
jgi:hypothetical protein